MTIIEVRPQSDEITLRQRWSHYFTLLFGAAAVVLALNLRDSAQNITRSYVNIEAGVRASYPQNWVIDQPPGLVFRVRDMARAGYKTTIQIALRPISPAASVRNLIDLLTLDRSQTLAAYSVLSRSPFLFNETEVTALQYAFVSSSENPFLETLPTVVRGLDILILRGSQAVIISFLADAAEYETQLPIFERFLASLVL
jgi:hypothetical protein